MGGTSINNVRRFLTYRVRRFLTYNVRFFGVIFDTHTNAKIGRYQHTLLGIPCGQKPTHFLKDIFFLKLWSNEFFGSSDAFNFKLFGDKERQ